MLRLRNPGLENLGYKGDYFSVTTWVVRSLQRSSPISIFEYPESVLSMDL